MQNLKWTDKIDKESDIEAKDVNSLANAIITIIDWINQDGGSSNIDLSEYVKKEEGKGLSSIANVRIENGADVTNPFNPDYFKEIYVDNQDETSDAVFVYDVNQIKSKLNEKQDKPQIITLTITDSVTLEDNQEVYLGVCDSLTLVESDTAFVGLHSYFVFESGETPTVLSPLMRIWFVGDDCNDARTFTPQPNTRYEVDVKIIKWDEESFYNEYIARVGAC